MDNTQLGVAAGGDSIRTLDKTGTGAPKTEVVALDLGGGDGRSEYIGSYPLPVKLDDVPQDDDGNPFFSLSPASMDNVEMLFRQLMAAQGYPRTSAEITALVTPTNLSYPPGNVLRYGADSTGLQDSSPAFRSALLASDYVFVPQGSFLLNSQVTINQPTTIIEGACPFWTKAGTLQGGTQILLGVAAGSGAAAFAWTGAGASQDYGSITLSRLGIRLNNPGLQQIGIRISQALFVTLSNCFILGQGTASDDTVAVQFDGLVGPYQYSGNINILDSYFANHLTALNVQGVVTTFRVTNTTFAGTAGHATSTGILLGNGGNTNNGTAAQIMVGFSIIGCEFDQWHVAIQSWAQQVRQLGNYFEGNTTAIMGGNYAISAITKANPAVITLSTASTNHPLATTNLAISTISNAASAVVTLSSTAVSNPVSINVLLNFANVGGMTAINGLSGTVTAVGGSTGAWTATVNINSSGFGVYTSGGTVGLGAFGNAVNPTGIVGMVEMNGLQGVISSIAGTSGAWTVSLGGANGYGAINSTAFTTYTSGGTLGTAQNFNWVRGIAASSTQSASAYDLFVSGTSNFPQTSTDLNAFLGPATTYFGSLDSTASQGQMLYFNNHLLSPATKVTYDGVTLTALAIPFYNSSNALPGYVMNGGAHYGHMTMRTTTQWGLGWGTTQTALGTYPLSWNDSGIAIQIVGYSGTHSMQHTDSAAAAFNTGYLETPVGNHATPYTAVLADSGKVLYYNGTGAAAFTIPANASVAYPVGTELTFVNDATGATNMTIAITTDTMILSPGGTTGSRTLAQFGRAKAVKLTATRWLISGSGLT